MRAKFISLASVSSGLKNLCNQNFLCSLKVCELFSAHSLLSLVHSYAAFLLVGRVCGGGVGRVGHEYAIAQITLKSLYIFLIHLIDWFKGDCILLSKFFVGSTRPTTSTRKTFINFVAAKQRQISNSVAERTKKRGQELMKLIELDTVSFDLFDMPPVKDYERFIQHFGRFDTTQVRFTEDGRGGCGERGKELD